MAYFFQKIIDQQEFVGPRSALDLQRAHFRNGRLSGVFEIRSMPQELEVLLYAGGEETGAYRLWPNSRLKITPAELGIGWASQSVPIRTVPLPDQASRALWQALEFQFHSQQAAAGLADWKSLLDGFRNERFTGIIQVASEACDGFVTLYEGLVAPGESIFCSSEGFITSLLSAEKFLDCPLKLTVYKADPSSQAYQCLLLRLGEVSWGRRILTNFKDMVGHKLLHLLNTNMNSMLIHNQANIHIAEAEIIDNHFFCDSRTAAGVYRTLFVDMSQLIGRVIGGMVTRRIMSLTYDQLGFNEREILQAHTLTPAALLK